MVRTYPSGILAIENESERYKEEQDDRRVISIQIVFWSIHADS